MAQQYTRAVAPQSGLLKPGQGFSESQWQYASGPENDTIVLRNLQTRLHRVPEEQTEYILGQSIDAHAALFLRAKLEESPLVLNHASQSVIEIKGLKVGGEIHPVRQLSDVWDHLPAAVQNQLQNAQGITAAEFNAPLIPQRAFSVV